MIRTRSNWVRSTNATSVLCRPHLQVFFFFPDAPSGFRAPASGYTFSHWWTRLRRSSCTRGRWRTLRRSSLRPRPWSRWPSTFRIRKLSAGFTERRLRHQRERSGTLGHDWLVSLSTRGCRCRRRKCSAAHFKRPLVSLGVILAAFYIGE